MRRLLFFLLALTGAFSISFPSAATPTPDDGLADDPLTAWIQRNGGGSGTDSGQKTGQVQNNGSIANLELIGHNDIGGRGFNADIYAHKGFAYIGQWGFGISNFPKFCPAGDTADPRNGVKILDLHAPGLPIVGTLRSPAWTSAEDITVFTPLFGPRQGRDIAAVGLQACFRRDNSIPRGLQLWDVTDPRTPEKLGFVSSGDNIRGVHELSIVQRPDLVTRKQAGKVLALEAVNFSQTFDAAGRGDLRIVDITDPSAPAEIGNWALREIGLTNQFTGTGCFARTFGHSASATADGKTAFFSAFDAGELVLDITDPTRPRFVRRARYPANESGDMDTHSADVTNDGRFLLVQDEDECRSNDVKNQVGWGYLRIFDLASRDANGDLVEIGTFKTPHSEANNDPSNGNYTIHHTAQNPAWSSTKVAISWYSDGVRVVDMAPVLSGAATTPIEVASFVPPAFNDPVGSCACLGNSAFVWGVVVADDGLIVISDMNSGVWVVRETHR